VGTTLTGNDLETPAANLTFVVTVNPAHGSLTGTGANRTYTPAFNYSGPDSFKFKGHGYWRRRFRSVNQQ
jgi:hypothetical protein